VLVCTVDEDVVGLLVGTTDTRDELQSALRTLSAKLEDIRTCSDLIDKHGTSLQRALVELECAGAESAAAAAADGGVRLRQGTVSERATLFRITTSAMINVRTCNRQTDRQLGRQTVAHHSLSDDQHTYVRPTGRH